MSETPLPHDWHQLLDRFTEALDDVQQTLAKAAVLESASPGHDKVSTLDEQLRAQAPKIAALNERATAIGAWVNALDSELRASEEVLRVLLSQTETVRQRLATWAGRAIG